MDARTQKLEARRDALLAQLRATPNLMRGTVTLRQRRCGRAACACARGGPRHSGLQLTVTLDGIGHARYVRQGELEQIQGLVKAYRDLWAVINELTRVNLELIRGRNPGSAGAKGKRGRR
ncbi:MAG: DUF6788 family protein [bacterium]